MFASTLFLWPHLTKILIHVGSFDTFITIFHNVLDCMISHRYSADIDKHWCSWQDITNVCVRNMSGLLWIIYYLFQFWIILCAFIRMLGLRLPLHHVIHCHFWYNGKCKCTFMNAALDDSPM